MKTKQTILFEGSLDKRISRAELGRIAKEAGYKVLFVWVQTDYATSKKRWLKHNPGEDSVFDHRFKQFSAPHESEGSVVISGRHTYSTQARTLLKRLTESRPTVQQSSPSLERPTIINRIRVE